MTPLFPRIALVGIGLIGSSLARVIRRNGLAGEIAIYTRSASTLNAARGLDLGDSYHETAEAAVAGADLVILCVPLGAISAVAEAISMSLAPGAIVSDVGSSKVSVIRDIQPWLPYGTHLVPAHPIAGTEHSGPESGFAELFEDRWCILTPLPDTEPTMIEKVAEFWRRTGSNVDIMDAENHDRVLAITSHLPHLIAFSIVDTATQLETDLQKEVIKFSSGGFRDFTRIAASDPVMWRDVFLNNRDAVLDILGRFSRDLAALQRAIRRSDGDALEEVFTRTRAVRRGVIEAKQDKPPSKP